MNLIKCEKHTLLNKYLTYTKVLLIVNNGELRADQLFRRVLVDPLKRLLLQSVQIVI
jgi:hypothetical protein